MRLVSVLDASEPVAAVVDGDRVVVLEPRVTMRAAVTAGRGAIEAAARAARRRSARGRDPAVALASARLGPAIADPGAIYTIGENYRAPGEPPGGGPVRPLVYGKAASSVGAPGATLRWDRALTASVDPEVELGVVVGRAGFEVPAGRALEHVFGYTVVNDVSSRDPWLDGDQWLLGKSLPGFCPVGPWIVTADELDPADLGLRCTIGGETVQDGRTSDMRFPVAEMVAFLSRHVLLRPGDLVATGTPPRQAGPPGPGRHLEPGDRVTCWIEGIGELTTTIG